MDKNFYYLTGLARPDLIYAAWKGKEKWEEFLFIPKVDPVQEKWVGKFLREEEAKETSGVDAILHVDAFENKLHQRIQQTADPVHSCYLDLAQNAPTDHRTPALAWASTFQDRYPQLKLENVAPQMAAQRFIKADHEIDQLKKAIAITDETFQLLLQKAPQCSHEHELEAYLDFSFRLHGAKHAFDTIAASGKNATVLHYVDNNAPLEKDGLILFDFGARWNNYCADISRTFPASGTFTPRQREVYSVVLDTLKKTVEEMKAGASMKEINAFSKDLLAKGCIQLGLITDESDVDKYYYHSIGHPLGLDTHDVGDRDMVLTPGMVYTCEPGLYIEEEGIGVRIEDDILITEEGPVNLSAQIIKEADDIEAFMKGN
ncbi:aminopeptidase P N-terminal domain-containing protein [Alkalibacter rhizosphaerae]|uniref:Xaa-Pro aminopeptidase n=1 Tax=Alkalibacter rhizosphaerae TaxID=2815577 RepID=A0A974XDR4_9FIRM|nr:aminopeptidase P family protein [Alkalibacter rhizosphaerae]QSX07791.1 aminopeptidase P N-terminal domain-containing protein [Alkalibacter rhizosphaerae]